MSIDTYFKSAQRVIQIIHASTSVTENDLLRILLQKTYLKPGLRFHTMNPNMKHPLKTIVLIAALGGLTAAANAQLVVWQDDFDQQPLGANSVDGTYGAVAFNYTSAGYGNPMAVITNDLPDTLNGYTGTNNCAFLFDTDPNVFPNVLNFGLQINQLPATGNTNTSLRAYTLNFDIAVQGIDIGGIGGYVAPSFGLYGSGSGEYYGNGCQTNVGTAFFPPAGSGYQHVSVPLDSFNTANAALLNPTGPTFAYFMAFYLAGHTYAGTVEIDLANISITMSNPPALPPPTMAVVPAKPALRIFAQDFTAPWNQEGFGTVYPDQSWVGVATPQNPVSYTIAFSDFDTVNNYTLYAQFVQNANPGDPYGVYNGQNALVWSISHQDSGFTTAVNWKTNAPTGNANNNALALTTTSLDGRGRWTLTFTNDTDGTVTAPDGSSGSFSLDPSITPNFANPLTIDFGTAPNSNAGYGQWIDISMIAITNVIDGNQYDDFTMDDVLNTSLWNPAFSLNNNPPSVIQVSTNTPYWVNWTAPAEGFGLATSTNLLDPNSWSSPSYWSGYSATNTTALMGGIKFWTLIPVTCLPTADGTPGSAPSTIGFFRLSNPPPAQ